MPSCHLNSTVVKNFPSLFILYKNFFFFNPLIIVGLLFFLQTLNQKQRKSSQCCWMSLTHETGHTLDLDLDIRSRWFSSSTAVLHQLQWITAIVVNESSVTRTTKDPFRRNCLLWSNKNMSLLNHVNFLHIWSWQEVTLSEIRNDNLT